MKVVQCDYYYNKSVSLIIIESVGSISHGWPGYAIYVIHYKYPNISKYRVYSNRTQAKKIISNLVCAQLESKQFQEMNFLALIRCCIVN